MRNCFHFFLILVLLKIPMVWGQTSSISLPKKISENSLDLSLRALSSENDFAKSNVFDLKVKYFSVYNINPFIFFDLNPVAQLQSGQIQSIDANDKLENKLSVLNAAVYFSWLPSSHFALGVLNSQKIYSPLLVGEKGFFTAELKQSFAFNSWKMGAKTSASIPNSESAVSDQNEKESTPFLTSATVFSEWKVNSKNQTLFSIQYFKYSQIPNSISTESIQNGNTPNDFKISETERSFKYDYEGFSSSLSFTRSLIRNLYLMGDASALQNQKAPESLNKAYFANGGLGISLNKLYDIEANMGIYRVEPDAIIAYYGNSRFFKANHQGYELTSTFIMRKEKFKISFSMNDAKLVYENPSQSNEKFYFLKFEVYDVAI